jgi:transcriptional regulator GlxA family with amidase domain
MESRQGKPLSPERIAKIKKLLAKTDLSLNDIAVRMGCSSGRVGHINRQFGIRDFGKKRSTWLVSKTT